MVAWGFIFYLLVNIGDVLWGFLPGYEFLGSGTAGKVYRTFTDILSVSVLVGMTILLVRRFLLHDKGLQIHERTPLLSNVRRDIRRDSAIVGAFILVHVGARFVGESYQLALRGSDVWQPFASQVSRLWTSWSTSTLETGVHISWWFAIGGIILFLPYFLFSKHIHLFLAPVNDLLHPDRRSIGELDALDFDDESVEQFGASNIEHLSWKGLLDAYACIMCNRCQTACPAYTTGKVLSPAALEINKRYFLNREGARLARGEASNATLIDFALPEAAVWGCTSCGACVEVCPVGNEPMRDILEIRRHLVLMENAFPEELQSAYRGMERSANPWNVPPEKRMNWADGLRVPTVAEKPDSELLWWVGCAPSTDPRAQKSARSFAEILFHADVDFAVLGSEERCTGDSARRSGNEYLFQELAVANVGILNRVNPRRIVTSCPHCLHTLLNEYPAFGGNYEVIHHTQLLEELIQTGKIVLDGEDGSTSLAFHDPCYLGRQNNVYDAPRNVLKASEIQLNELPRTRRNSFCCGAGGAQIWKEEEDGDRRISTERINEVIEVGENTLAVACPFCMIMLDDAAKSAPEKVEIRDVVEIVRERLEPQE